MTEASAAQALDGTRPPQPRVYTIPAGAPFLPTLADALLSGRLAPLAIADPLALAEATVFLPTRRAVRAFREALTERLGGGAAILPRIRPIGDVDEEDHLLDPSLDSAAEQLLLPPAIGGLARRLALTRLTLAWGRSVSRSLLELGPDEAVLIPASAADAAGLAADLARLIDDMAIAGVGWEAIGRLAPEAEARYFQITLDFLKIAAEHWPAFLAEKGLAEPAARRDHLIRAAAARLARQPPAGPVIAAGSTGSVAATAELLKAVSRLDRGAVVLPGLDQALSADGWNAVGDSAAGARSHPQFGLKQLLAGLGVSRDEVASLARPPRPIRIRTRLVSEALRPADTTDRWASFRAPKANPRAVEAALVGMSLLIARNEQEEALAIALAIREAIEKGERTIAVVTPDRPLARRIAVELGRWQLAVDDSAGAPLDGLPAGVFARLLTEAVSADGDPACLLALLKHPYAAFGLARPDCRRAARAVELALFRGRRVTGGTAALAPALAASRREAETDRKHLSAARRRIAKRDWDLAETLVAHLTATLAPVETALGAGGVSAASASLALQEALALAATDETGRDDLLWSGLGGAGLAELLDGLASPEGAQLDLHAADVAPFLSVLMRDVRVTRPAGTDPRIHIWGTLEARLQSVGLLILAGMEEGVWPAETRTDPWLSRSMRAEIGLPPPERRIGLAAHDFALALAAPRVIIARAEKREGTPTVASRWLQRLAALLGEESFAALKARAEPYVELARDLDREPYQRVRPVKRPDPKPPVPARPRQLSVTDIEALVRDPYAIYAEHVLKLAPLDPLGMLPDYAARGTIIHDALGKFAGEWTGPFDANAEARLVALGRAALAEIAGFPDIHAIWSIRFAAIARWLIAWEAQRSPEIDERKAEIPGRLAVAAPAGPFNLTGRADRIDLRRDGTIEIIDFKTGSPPSARQVLVGFAPQLALEAAMASEGGFGDAFAGRSISELNWIALGRVERGRPLVSAVEDGWTADLVGSEALARFASLIAAFDDPERGYVSRARPMFETRYESPYDHLARVREWGLVESEEDLFWAARPPSP